MHQEKSEFVFGSGPMARVLERFSRVAPLDTTVLVQGESGTGKEVAARFLHQRHPGRSAGPLICVHCGAMPDSLLESELFGHMRGAFTGAERDRVGKFEQADGGTLFLDEISTMSPEAQVRLLRVLQERRVTRIGSTGSRAVDVRVVVATNQDLQRMVDRGQFRLDLLYRINVYPVTLPPLRERPGDVEPLAQHFAAELSPRFDSKATPRFTTEALAALVRYEWPGNVRELENAVEYALIECGGTTSIDRHHLPRAIGGYDEPADGASAVVVTEEGLSLRTAVTNLERELIFQSLRLAEGNKARAAELLDLKRTTFLEKMRRLDLDEPARPEG